MNDFLFPWTNISWNNTIADCDKGYPVKIGKQEFEFGSKAYVDYINRKDEERKEKYYCPLNLFLPPYSQLLPLDKPPLVLFLRLSAKNGMLI
jgi:hypothetical protein